MLNVLQHDPAESLSEREQNRDQLPDSRANQHQKEVMNLASTVQQQQAGPAVRA